MASSRCSFHYSQFAGLRIFYSKITSIVGRPPAARLGFHWALGVISPRQPPIWPTFKWTGRLNLARGGTTEGEPTSRQQMMAMQWERFFHWSREVKERRGTERLFVVLSFFLLLSICLPLRHSEGVVLSPYRRGKENRKGSKTRR